MHSSKDRRPCLRRATAPLALSLGIALTALAGTTSVRAESAYSSDPAAKQVDPPATKERPVDLRKAARGRGGSGALPVWAERYEKPVYRNGRRVTWRGKWREDAEATTETPDAVPLPPEAPDRPAPLRLSLAVEPSLAGFAGELNGFVAQDNILVETGAAEADLALLPADQLSGAKDWQAVARLFPVEVHLIARPGLASLADLKMRSVVIGAAGSPQEATMRSLLDRLDAGALLISEDPSAALSKLGAPGGPDAVIFFAGAGQDVLAAAPEGARRIALPYGAKLGDDWLPATLTDAGSERLRGGAPVDTLAMSLVLAARTAEAGSERFRRLDAFTKAFFDRAGQTPHEGASPKWAEVNVAARTSPLPRFEPAQDRLASMTAK